MKDDLNFYVVHRTSGTQAVVWRAFEQKLFAHAPPRTASNSARSLEGKSETVKLASRRKPLGDKRGEIG